MSCVCSAAHVQYSNMGGVTWSTRGMFVCRVCILQHTWNVNMPGVYYAAHVEYSNVGGVFWSTRRMFIRRVCVLQHTCNIQMWGVYSGARVECSYVGVYSGAHVECSYVGCVFCSTRGMLICRGCIMQHTWNF